MKNHLNIKLIVENEDEEVLGKIEAFTLESFQEQFYKIEKTIEDNEYICDTCSQPYPLSELIELDEDTHICGKCNAESEPMQEDLD